MDTLQFKQLKKNIKRELPGMMRDDPEIRQLIVQLAREQFADKKETESRFDRILNELRRDREANEKKWEANEKRWEEERKASEEKWKANKEKWAENDAELKRLLKRLESGIGALGARWGTQSEKSFRNALKSILEESFSVEVLNITDFDDEGVVFGHPDQIELDIIIKNGVLIVCGIKSSMNRGNMYIFDRKVTFYEKKHKRKADRKIVISPMITKRAKKVAQKFGIEVYSYADDVENL